MRNETTTRGSLMAFAPDRSLCLGIAAMLVFGAMLAASGRTGLAEENTGPTVEEYINYIGDKAVLVPPGQLKIDGQRVLCGRRPTVLDPTLDDYGAAFPTFLILNPERFKGIPKAVKLYIYSHECAHQFRGPNERIADCFAVRRGRVYGWLTPKGLDQICEFISKAAATNDHFAGPKRCEYMRACFADKDTIY